MSDSVQGPLENGAKLAVLDKDVQNLVAEVKTLKEAYFGNGKPGLKTTVERVLELAQVIHADQKLMAAKLAHLERTVENEQTQQQVVDKENLAAIQDRKEGRDRGMFWLGIGMLVVAAISLIIAVVVAVWTIYADTHIKNGEMILPKISTQNGIPALSFYQPERLSADPTIVR